MDCSWKNQWSIFITTAFLIGYSNGFQITPNSEYLIMNKSKNIFTLTMDENNHVPNASTRLLFTITDVTEFPSFTFTDPTKTFKYKIQNTLKVADSYDFLADQVFDYETQEHDYLLLYSSTEPYFVRLQINNIDDEPPTLSTPMCEFKENFIYDVHNSTCTCTLGDPDGWLRKTTFPIVNSPKGRESEIFEFVFKEQPKDTVYTWPVYIVLKEKLDYEKQTFYSFNVNARDGANHPTTPNPDVRTIVYVEDQNDKPPEWQIYTSTAQFLEKTKQEFYVAAVDGDKGIMATINYTVSDDNIEQCIQLNDPHNGTIQVSPIDRDARDLLTYQFTITAQEEDIPPFETPLTITYYLEDQDDNAPLVIELLDLQQNLIKSYTRNEKDQKEITFNIMEMNNNDTYAKTLDLYINVTDIDTGKNAQFDISLENYNQSEDAEDFVSAFDVVPNAGYRTGKYQINIKDKSKLDYEVASWDIIKFYVHSKGTLDPSLEDKLFVIINLGDYNDETPKFSETEYTATVNETIKNGAFIEQVLANDRDAVDQYLKHEIIGSPGLLRIESKNGLDGDSGNIYVNKDNAFDFDKINPVVVQIKATDQVGHSATVPLTINLLDVNNKAPTINVEGIIRVDENQLFEAVLNTSITASDVDTTRKLTAKINWNSSYAMKNSQQVTRPDLVELTRFLDLTYSTDDETGSITIHLIVNEQTNILPAPDYETFDTLYLNITVTDENTDPDFIVCCKSTSALITININDLNDNPPVFTDTTLEANRTAYEWSDNGVMVGTIVATDADVGDIVTYNCIVLEEDGDRDWFTFNVSTGDIKVNVDKKTTLSADNYPKRLYVSYQCGATDTVHWTYQNFSIYIIDKNNQVPKYEDDFFNITIDEQSEKDTVVHKISTSDLDRDIPFHTVHCAFYIITEPCYQSFYISTENSNAVQVKVGKNDLNRDTGTKSYVCSVRCSDNPNRDRGEDILYTDAKFTITLNDINNNSPELLTKTITASEKLTQNDVIAKVQTKDIDSGVNAETDIDIIRIYKNKAIIENDLFDFKEMDDYNVDDNIKQLTLYALKDLRDFYGDYLIHINMRDRGIPQQHHKDVINVAIKRFNYYAPSFIFPGKEDKTIVLNLDQKLYSQLSLHLGNKDLPDLRITDNDKNTCSKKWTTIFNLEQTEPNGNSIFTINSTSATDECSAQLQVNNFYNKDIAKQQPYKVKLTASLRDGEQDTENDEKPLDVTQDIVISFFDINQDPVFNTALGPWKLVMEEDNALLLEALPKEFQAYYPNVPEDYTKYYYLHSSEKSVKTTFTVDENTGALSLQKSLTFLEIRKYNFQIVASKDQTPDSKTDASYLNVEVYVRETNRNIPQWEKHMFFGAIMSTYPKEYKILTANASDLDELDQGKLKYKITSAIERKGSESIFNVNDTFAYDEETGDITLKFVVDNSMTGYFWFNISVEDAKDWKGNGPHYNYTNVTIYIISQEKNTVTFRFANTLQSVIKEQAEILEIVSKNLGADCYSALIDRDSQNGQDMDDQTIANIYCIELNTPITTEDVLKKLANYQTFQNLRSTLMNTCSVWLLPFTTESDPANLEETLTAALIGVSVLLGACCIILGITFFLKTRELNRRLKKLTEHKFGSDESDLNRKGINGIHAPNTNVHAVEGSNPVFNVNGMKDKDFGFDRASIHSGESDLIGVEDNPEFDFFNNNLEQKERF